MRKIVIILCLILPVFGLQAKDRPGFYLDSLNLGVPVKTPVSHYREFSDFQFGFAMQSNFKFGGADHFKIFLSVDSVYNFNSTPRIDHLVDTAVTLGFGWDIYLGDGGLTLSPQFSGGMVLHILNGDFYLDGNSATDLYFDQLYRFQLELAYTFGTAKEKHTHIGLYLSPSIEVFPGETYWGLIVGGSAGIRLQFDPEFEKK